MTEKTKMVSIKLTLKQADLVSRNVDGWLDAGACEDGLTPDEHEALWSVVDQISAAKRKHKRAALAAGENGR